VQHDADIPAEKLQELCEVYKNIIKRATGKNFPQEPAKQLRGAIEAVFRSWNGTRAIAYRIREKISHDLGTAVNVQAIQAQINTEQLKRDATTNLNERRTATQRIAALRQAGRIESGIAEGRNEVALNQSAGLARGFTAAEQFQSRVAQTNDNFLKAFTGTYANANASLNASNAVATELARQQELSRPVAGSVLTADIRTAEGAALVLGLGAAAQDPNLIEAKLQTKQLTGIRTAITNAVSGYIGTVAEIF